jgi:hypothetical protein
MLLQELAVRPPQKGGLFVLWVGKTEAADAAQRTQDEPVT